MHHPDVPNDHTPVPTPEVVSPVVAISTQTLTIASLALAVLLVACASRFGYSHNPMSVILS